MADTSVKFFHSGMTGAPTLGGVAGNMISILDACLVDGFGLKTMDSVMVAGNVATCSVASGHIFEVGSVVLVAGATPSGLNGEQKVTAVTATTFTFATTGISNQTATGTITIKLAAAGWTKAFTGTNLAAYKSSDIGSTGCYLRVDDTATLNARVVGYESMSAISSGTNPFPTAAQQSGGGYWAKAHNTTGTRTWLVIADARAVYFAVAYYSNYPTSFALYFFGDIVSFKSGDAYHAMLSSYSADVAASGANGIACVGYSEKSVPASSIGKYVARAFSQLGTARPACVIGAGNISSSAAYSGSTSYGVAAYPNNADNGLFACAALVLSDAGIRGSMPGLWHIPQNIASIFAHRDRIAGSGVLNGKSMMVVTAYATNGAAAGAVLFDATGPWR